MPRRNPKRAARPSSSHENVLERRVTRRLGPTQLAPNATRSSPAEPSTCAVDAGATSSETRDDMQQDGSDNGCPSDADSKDTGTQDGCRERIQPDPLERGDDEPNIIHLSDFPTTQRFIDMLRTADLENSGMQREDVDTLREPGPVLDLEERTPLLTGLRHFIRCAKLMDSRDRYDTYREIERLNNPVKVMLSYDQVQRRLSWLSGIVPLEQDMCINSCIAYTGPYDELDTCPKCYTTRYVPGTTTPRKQFTTIPIGPVIQAFYGSRDIAEHMHYLEKRLAANLAQVKSNGGRIDKYDDTSSSQELLDAWNAGTFKKSDVALQLSMDGAHLHPDDPSEAWVFVWVFHNLPPEMRYKKQFVIPGAIVPGPNKPGNIDSFLFPSLFHVAALQREGLKIYDAFLDTHIARSIPSVIFASANTHGSVAMSGLGYSKKFDCRLYCDMPSRHCRGNGHYYPAANRPDNYEFAGCTHNDIRSEDLSAYRSHLPHKYKENLAHLLAADTQEDYRTRRFDVGLCKQTLFSGLPHQPLPVPSIFTKDLMHLNVLQDIADLFLKLFTGKIDVYGHDDRSTWDWAVFYQNNRVWRAHGESVARAAHFIPSSFGSALRDPAKKLNEAREFQQYMYGLGPTFFRHLLPHKYWVNFCKLVAGIRILQRRVISHADLLRGNELLADFAREFEDLYYQRMESRLHFVRHSIHLLTHVGPETFRIGPSACHAQSTLETAIRNLGRETYQDCDMIDDFTQQAITRAQINSLSARFPRIRFEHLAMYESDASSHPNSAARKLEEDAGYIFLPRCEESPYSLREDERDALEIYWKQRGWPNEGLWPNAVCRWAKLQLPNGQKACSFWYENSNATQRRSSCVEIELDGSTTTRIGKVHFYFYISFGETRHSLAMVSLFSLPDPEVLAESSGAVYLCEKGFRHKNLFSFDDEPDLLDFRVIPVTAIHSVVSMFPEFQVTRDGCCFLETGRFSLMRHPDIELVQFSDGSVFNEDDDSV